MSRNHTDWQTEYYRQKRRRRRNVDKAWRLVMAKQKADERRKAALLDKLTERYKVRAAAREGGLDHIARYDHGS